MTPFLIVGMPRTGSTLLFSGLAQHPDVRIYSEVFHPVRSERTGGHAIRRNGSSISFDETRDDAIRFLDEIVFPPSETRAAVGCKIFAEYVRCAGTEGLFQRLRDHYKTLHVIHVVRQNYLDVLVSREVADKTQEWARYTATPPAPAPALTIDAAAAENFFEYMKVADHFFEAFFRPDLYLKLGYEDLSKDYAATISLVYDFLGLEQRTAMMRVFKQIREPFSEIISNYQELKSHFQNSEFGVFFPEAA